jgi:hypothetical protein
MLTIIIQIMLRSPLTRHRVAIQYVTIPYFLHHITIPCSLPDALARPGSPHDALGEDAAKHCFESLAQGREAGGEGADEDFAYGEDGKVNGGVCWVWGGVEGFYLVEFEGRDGGGAGGGLLVWGESLERDGVTYMRPRRNTARTPQRVRLGSWTREI